MVHRFIFVKRKPGMAEEEFLSYWKDVHAVKYGQKIQQATRYLINTRVPMSGETGESAFDGAAEVWMNSIEDAMAFIQSDEYVHGSRADEPNFLAFWQMVAFDTDDTEVIPGADPGTGQGVKLIQTVKRKEGVTLDQFRHRAAGDHAARVKKLPGLRRYTVGNVVDMFYGMGETLLDGISSLWFDDQAAAERALASDVYRNEVLPDLAAFTQPRYAQHLLTTGHWVLGPAFR